MSRVFQIWFVSVALLMLVSLGCNGGAETRDDPPPDEEEELEPADHDEDADDEDADPYADDDPVNGREEEDADTDARPEDDDEEETDPTEEDPSEEETEEPEEEELPAEPTSYPDWAEGLQQDVGSWFHAYGYGHSEAEAAEAARAALHELVTATVKGYLATIEIDPDADTFDPDLIDSYAETIADDVIDGAESVQSDAVDPFVFAELRLNFDDVVTMTINNFGNWFSFARQVGPPPERPEVALGLSETQEEVAR